MQAPTALKIAVLSVSPVPDPNHTHTHPSQTGDTPFLSAGIMPPAIPPRAGVVPALFLVAAH